MSRTTCCTPSRKIIYFRKLKPVLLIFIEEQQTSVRCRSVEYLLMSKVNDMLKMPAFCQQATQRLAILRVEKLVRQDKAEPPMLIEQR